VYTVSVSEGIIHSENLFILVKALDWKNLTPA